MFEVDYVGKAREWPATSSCRSRGHDVIRFSYPAGKESWIFSSFPRQKDFLQVWAWLAFFEKIRYVGGQKILRRVGLFWKETPSRLFTFCLFTC